MDHSPPGSSVHGILQARILEWVAIPFSKGIFPTQGLNPHLLCLLHWQASSLPLAPRGKPSRWCAHFYFLSQTAAVSIKNKPGIASWMMKHHKEWWAVPATLAEANLDEPTASHPIDLCKSTSKSSRVSHSTHRWPQMDPSTQLRLGELSSSVINFSAIIHAPGDSVVKNLPANAGDAGSSPGSGRFPEEGNRNPFQYLCLGNSMDREAWQATVHGVPESRSWCREYATTTTTKLLSFRKVFQQLIQGALTLMCRSEDVVRCLQSGFILMVVLIGIVGKLGWDLREIGVQDDDYKIFNLSNW